ncbi:hypothetical protein FB107DRAFT_276747 [Schizophyllum commune]
MNTQHPLQEQMMSSSDGQQQQQQIDWNAALGGAGGMGMGMGMQQLPNELIGSRGGAVMSPQQGNMDGSQQFNPQLLLEQQFKLTQLQQLQQLQNQIFQQQLAIISGQNNQALQDATQDPGTPSGRQTQYHGLPTPGPSSELRPQQPPVEFISPIVLSGYTDGPPTPSSTGGGGFQDMVPPLPLNMGHYEHHHGSHHDHALARGSMSAPANVAFHQTNDLDFDVSPLTSPWLGPGHHGGQHNQHQHHNGNRNAMQGQGRASLKRPPSPGNEDANGGGPARKKVPSTRPAPARRSSAQPRGSRSTNSTPLLHAVAEDSPSPVDLSMPPPAPPPPSNGSNGIPEHLMPITPSIMMNMSRFGLTAADTIPGSGSATPMQQEAAPVVDHAKTNGTSKRRGSSAGGKQGIDVPAKATRSRSSTRKAASGSMSPSALVSPGLKAILPAGTSQSSAQFPKKSHKAAEQKRRDSMKTTIDDLRGLLPPIPLPSALGEQGGEPGVLPGALPPRGPPKAGGEGPNKGVSKLQLLICSNEYIRRLKGRVARRDEEIERLRAEVRRLRVDGGAGGSGAFGEEGELDLERDLDVGEEAMTYGYAQRSLMDEDGDEDGDM